MYDDPSFEPCPAEEVIVHCVFAIMLWQFVVRNWENPVQQADFNRRSNLHYHYALSFFRQLMASHTLQDVQAMSMLCIHLRALPKPGACWMMTSTTLNLAIELGLHRSMRSWAPDSRKISVLEIEIRKRIFWSVLVIHVIISGKLGRPMPLREEDYDVELPQAVDDNLLSDEGIDTSREGKCDFLVGMTAFRFQPICTDLYNNIYAVKRSPQTYIETVMRLEHRIQGYIDSLDTDLMRRWASTNDVTKVYPLYIRMWPLEFRLLLRHPSLSLTSSTEFNNESLTICMDLSKQILIIVKQLQAWKSLDSNWQTGALFVLAISTTLFGHWERRDELTLAGFDILKDDMRSWLSIMGDMGRFLGTNKVSLIPWVFWLITIQDLANVWNRRYAFQSIIHSCCYLVISHQGQHPRLSRQRIRKLPLSPFPSIFIRLRWSMKDCEAPYTTLVNPLRRRFTLSMTIAGPAMCLKMTQIYNHIRNKRSLLIHTPNHHLSKHQTTSLIQPPSPTACPPNTIMHLSNHHHSFLHPHRHPLTSTRAPLKYPSHSKRKRTITISSQPASKPNGATGPGAWPATSNRKNTSIRRTH